MSFLNEFVVFFVLFKDKIFNQKCVLYNIYVNIVI